MSFSLSAYVRLWIDKRNPSTGILELHFRRGDGNSYCDNKSECLLWSGASGSIYAMHLGQAVVLETIFIFVCRWCLTILITLLVVVESK